MLMLCVGVHLSLICVILLLVMTGLIMVMVIRVRRRIAIVVVLVVAVEIPLIVLVISSISFPSSSSPRASGTERFLPPYIRFRLCLHLLTFTRYFLYVDLCVYQEVVLFAEKSKFISAIQNMAQNRTLRFFIFHIVVNVPTSFMRYFVNSSLSDNNRAKMFHIVISFK